LPDESCRHCGGKLAENSKCPQCMKTNSMVCKRCACCTPEQFHSNCMFYNTDQTHTVSKFKYDNNSLVALAWLFQIREISCIQDTQV